ncbi:MAG TPA: OsmC family protein [Jatrophihabitantaceae bacterium]|nr:OsmC family protein [Jatrophihabitantaceae bacterium]
MPAFDVDIRMADAGGPAIEPGALTFKHHLTDSAQITIGALSGGHLLHLAVAGCLFNDILREAGQRGVTITELQVTADGAFAGDPLLSTGVHYDVTIAGDAPDTELHSLVADCQEASAVAASLRRGTPVEAGEVHIG